MIEYPLSGADYAERVSGWYARLDRCLDNRQTQIEMWLDAWENSLEPINQ